MRLWKEGGRDLVMDICCALDNFRVCLTPWQSMVESGETHMSLTERGRPYLYHPESVPWRHR